MKKPLILIPLVLALAACSTTSPDVVQRGDAQRLSTVQDATVLSVRPVKVDGTQSGLGGAAGGVVGGVAGSGIGGGRGAVVGTVLGAVAGAVAGNAIERGTTTENALEILVQLRNGERRSIIQATGQETFNTGDPVLLVTTGGKTRVTKGPRG
jgi:outer membrane lipoprotein SlyB